MEHYKNLSLESIIEIVDGVICVEKWIGINGFEDYYEISDFGRAKSLAKEWSVGRKGDTILRQGGEKDRYLSIVLCVDRKKKSKNVHRLVADHFCVKKEGCKVVNHLNTNTKDNRALNLEWTTSKGNVKHSFVFGNRKSMNGEKNINATLNENVVSEIRKLYEIGGLTLQGIGDLYNIRKTAVYKIVKRQIWKHVTN